MHAGGGGRQAVKASKTQRKARPVTSANVFLKHRRPV